VIATTERTPNTFGREKDNGQEKFYRPPFISRLTKLISQRRLGSQGGTTITVLRDVTSFLSSCSLVCITVIPQLTKIIRSGLTFVSRNLR